MASLRTIRTRIRSVKSTQKITRAMKMVAAAKLRRAQEGILRARPYALAIDQVLGHLVARTAGAELHPLLAVREPKRVELVLLTSDRGLCGGFNSNIIRRAQRFITENQDKYDAIQTSTIGRRGRDFAKKKNLHSRKDYVGLFGNLRYGYAQQIADELCAHFIEEKLDAVFLLYNEFKSAITYQISLVPLLPLRSGQVQAGDTSAIDYLYEPSQKDVLEGLLPRYLAMQIWRALLESEASEHGARMAAMDSATKNAGEMIASLTLQYNRARQAMVTKELMEIVGGAEALRG